MRPKSEAAKQHKRAYDIDYNRKNVVRKFIPFNKTNAEDSKMLGWLDSKQNVTRYVKDLIREDMPGE